MKTILQLAGLYFILVAFCSCTDYPGSKIKIDPEFGTFTDTRDGYQYKTVKINDQVWFAENLRYLPAVSPSSVGSLTTAHYYVYDYQGNIVNEAIMHSNYEVYGAFYNWEAARISCPSGWRLPSDDDFKTLEFVLGLEPVGADMIEWRYGGDVGKQLKSNTLWENDGGGTNSSGFKALPAGYKNGIPVFDDLLKFTHFWTATADGTEKAYHRSLRANLDGVYRNRFSRDGGFSVRCMKE